MKNLRWIGFLLILAGILMTACVDTDKGTEDIEPVVPVEPAEVTVTFNADGGSPKPAPVTLEKGESMGDKYPADPEKAGNTFEGWYEGDTKYIRTTPVNGNINLKAKWKANPLTTMVNFTNLTQDGSATAATTKLTLTFDKDIADLTADDITLTDLPTGAQKGSLTGTGTGVYDLALSNITANGTVWVYSVTKAGHSVSGTPKSVDIFAAPVAVEPPGGGQIDLGSLGNPSQTGITQLPNYQGKTDVQQMSPSGGTEYGWAVLTYDLGEYAGKEITIDLSMDVWLSTSAKIVWQANLGGSYPVIAGSYTDLSAGQWHNVAGSNTINVPAGGGTLYISGGGSGGQLSGKNVSIYIANFSLTIDDGSGTPPEPPNPPGGGWTGGPAQPAVPAGGWKTAAVGVNMLELEPMRNLFSDYFMMGNIAVPADYNTSGTTITNQRLTHHYNVLTAENHMKPDSYGGNRPSNSTTVSGLSFTNSDRFVTAATNSGFRILAHVLLWHNQTSGWQKSLPNDATQAKAILESYITQVVTHFQGKVWAWDVLNEVFPDGVGTGTNANWRMVMRGSGAGNSDNQGANPWYIAYGGTANNGSGANFVFDAYKAARAADPNAKLYYNDYNLDSSGKSDMVRDMVKAVNDQWKTDPAYDNRNLIEGIGMQSHHNTNVTQAQIRTSLNKFKALGVNVSISELDVLCGGYSSSLATKGPSAVASDANRTSAANLYYQYFKLFMEYSDIIERVTFWGVYDEQSWRSAGEPLPFKGTGTSTVKSAYVRIIDALEGR